MMSIEDANVLEEETPLEVVLWSAIEAVGAEGLMGALEASSTTSGLSSVRAVRLLLQQHCGGGDGWLVSLAARSRALYAYEKYGKALLEVGVERCELAEVLDRMAKGDAVSTEDVERADVRQHFEGLMRGLGLQLEPQETLDGDVGFQSSSSENALRELAKQVLGEETTTKKEASTTDAKKKRSIGPALPPSDVAIERDSQADGPRDDSSDDDDVGPSADPAIERARALKPAPLLRRPDGKPKNPWLTTRDGGRGDCGGQREDWMMTPPSELEFASTQSGAWNIPVAKSRFTAEKTNVKITEAPPRLTDSWAGSRGPSLLEQHQQRLQQQQGNQKKKKHKTDNKPWSREDDLLATAKLDPKARDDLIKNAKSLNDRFSSSIQTSFT